MVAGGEVLFVAAQAFLHAGGHEVCFVPPQCHFADDALGCALVHLVVVFGARYGEESCHLEGGGAYEEACCALCVVAVGAVLRAGDDVEVVSVVVPLAEDVHARLGFAFVLGQAVDEHSEEGCAAWHRCGGRDLEDGAGVVGEQCDLFEECGVFHGGGGHFLFVAVVVGQREGVDVAYLEVCVVGCGCSAEGSVVEGDVSLLDCCDEVEEGADLGHEALGDVTVGHDGYVVLQHGVGIGEEGVVPHASHGALFLWPF